MFNLNFISNPGIQIKDSNASWSYVIQEDNSKLNEKLDIYNSKILSKKNSTWIYLLAFFVIIISILVVAKFSSPTMKSNIVLNNVIDIIVESEHNMILQLVEVNFLLDKAEILIRSEKTKDIQLVLEEYYLQKHILYELYQKGEYNYISIVFPWKIDITKQDVSNFDTIMKKTRFSNLIISSSNETGIEIQGKSTDIISFLLYMAESNQIQNYYYSIFYNEYDNFKLKIFLNLS